MVLQAGFSSIAVTQETLCERQTANCSLILCLENVCIAILQIFLYEDLSMLGPLVALVTLPLLCIYLSEFRRAFAFTSTQKQLV